MSKRRATEELYSADNHKRQDASSDRAVEFTAHLRGLNSQFAQWVQEQAGSSSDQLWVEGVKDYIHYADKLVDDFQDILKNGSNRSSPPLANNLFGTPAPAAAAVGSLEADTGRSTGAAAGGRKSVSFAPTPAVGAALEAAVTTPGPNNTTNTTDAGHTPAPASGLGFTFGATPGATPNGAGNKDLPSPEPIKWGASTPAATAAGTSAAGTSNGAQANFSFGVNQSGSTPSPAGFGQKPPAAADAAPATKGFTFGVSSSSTPAATAADTSDTAAAADGSRPSASPYPSSLGGFSFGTTPPASTSTTPGTAASSGTPASGFTFGALPSTSAAGVASNSSPIFPFAAGTAAAGTSAPSMFGFPAPGTAAAAAGGDAAGGGEGDGAEEEAPAKYKPEITVDENTWQVFFNGKARLHVRRHNDGKTEWDPKGVGVLTVRQKKDGSDSSTYVTFTNDGGKPLVSSRLAKATEVHIVPEQPKRCRMSLTVISYELPPAGTDAAPATTGPKYSVEVCMISLSSAEKMLELQKAVNEHKPK